MKRIRPVYLPPLYQEAADYGRILLRDGTVATVQVAKAEDRPALAAFFEELAGETRFRRYLGHASRTLEQIVDLSLEDAPEDHLVLLVTRTIGRNRRIIAAGIYFRRDKDTAEVALAVDEEFHGKGLGTLLLERLALLAVQHGFANFVGYSDIENSFMLEIFRHSGFEFKERQSDQKVEVSLSVAPTKESVERAVALDSLFTVASLQAVFKPRSIAVIGASRDPASIGHRIMESLINSRFQGPVYPVNPKASVIRSMRAYASVTDIPERVDMAVIVVPARFVLQAVDECAAQGVRALVVITAGFAEAGQEGRLLQEELLRKIRGYGMRMVGPNCLGVLNTDPAVQMNASFSPVYPKPGNISLLSQSGALGIAILAMADERGLGLGSFVSIGNKADISGNDLLQYWEQDPSTKLILLYLESFRNPRRFMQLARRVGRSTPIVLVKGGRTQAGRRAAGSHTAALAASDTAVDALMRQTGVVRVSTIQEMFDVAEIFSLQPLPKGKRVAIVTNAGGLGILCADACETHGLEVAAFSDAMRARLAEFLPSAAGLSNPIDMIASASPEEYSRVIQTVLTSGDIDALIVIYIAVGVTRAEDIMKGIADGVQKSRQAGAADKPVVSCFMGETGDLPHIVIDGERSERIPTYLFPESAAIALGKAARYAEWRGKPQGTVYDFEDARVEEARAVCRRAIEQRGGGWLSAEEMRELMSCMGLPVPPGGVAKTAEEAGRLAAEIGFPVAVKLASTTIVHKTEHGGVLLNLRDEKSVREGFEKIRKRLEDEGAAAAMEGVLVQPMLSGGVEVMVGVVDDPGFGPLIAFGLGGVHVEILRDVSFRITPLTDCDVEEMLQEIRGYRLLKGYRGHPSADIEGIKELLLRISLMLEVMPEIVELDLNPIKAMEPGKGCFIIDARVRVEEPSKERAVRHTTIGAAA